MDQLSETSQKRFINNPLRILDTKSEKELDLLKEAPKISNYYTEDDNAHIESLKIFLEEMDIPFTINDRLVRGLDYYTKTVFEFNSSQLGAQDAILGGGRYDGLVEVLGGRPTPGIGFAAGMERFLIAMDDLDRDNNNSIVDIYFVCLDEKGLSKTLQLSNQLRNNGLKVIFDPLRRSMKSQLRDANRSGARYALILGETEMNDDTIGFKDLEQSTQKTILQSEVLNFFDNLTN